MIRNIFTLFGVLMLMTACNGPQPETVTQGHKLSAVSPAGVEKSAGSLAAIAATPQASTPTSATSPEDDPMEEQRCVWRCLANSNGNTDPAYASCVAKQCGAGGESEGDVDSGVARADTAPAGSSWLVGRWAPDGLCADDTTITYRGNGTYAARSPGGDGDEGYEIGRWKLIGSRITWVAAGGHGNVRGGQTVSATIMRRANELIVTNLRGETVAVWSFSDQGSTPTPQRRCD